MCSGDHGDPGKAQMAVDDNVAKVFLKHVWKTILSPLCLFYVAISRARDTVLMSFIDFYCEDHFEMKKAGIVI